MSKEPNPFLTPNYKAALEALAHGPLTSNQAGELIRPVDQLAEAVRALHGKVAGLEEQLKYAKAPVDKGIPMHVHRVVCEQRNHELDERQRMTHRYEVEALRNKELEEQLATATAKAEGAAEAYEDIKAQAEDLRKAGGIRASLLRLLTEECASSAATIRKGLQVKEGK